MSLIEKAHRIIADAKSDVDKAEHFAASEKSRLHIHLAGVSALVHALEHAAEKLDGKKPASKPAAKPADPAGK